MMSTSERLAAMEAELAQLKNDVARLSAMMRPVPECRKSGYDASTGGAKLISRVPPPLNVNERG